MHLYATTLQFLTSCNHSAMCLKVQRPSKTRDLSATKVFVAALETVTSISVQLAPATSYGGVDNS